MTLNYSRMTSAYLSTNGVCLRSSFLNIPDIPQEADVQILSIEPGAVISKDAISVTGDRTTPNELLKSTASSLGTKGKIGVEGVETDVMFKASTSNTRPDVSTSKIPNKKKL